MAPNHQNWLVSLILDWCIQGKLDQYMSTVALSLAVHAQLAAAMVITMLISRSLFSMRKAFNYLCHLRMEEWYKIEIPISV